MGLIITICVLSLVSTISGILLGLNGASDWGFNFFGLGVVTSIGALICAYVFTLISLFEHQKFTPVAVMSVVATAIFIASETFGDGAPGVYILAFVVGVPLSLLTGCGTLWLATRRA